jgi:hypothetical protein
LCSRVSQLESAQVDVERERGELCVRLIDHHPRAVDLFI